MSGFTHFLSYNAQLEVIVSLEDLVIQNSQMDDEQVAKQTGGTKNKNHTTA